MAQSPGISLDGGSLPLQVELSLKMIVSAVISTQTMEVEEITNSTVDDLPEWHKDHLRHHPHRLSESAAKTGI